MLITTFMRLSGALVVCLSFTQANWFEANVFGRQSRGRWFPRRQIDIALPILSIASNPPSGTGLIFPAEVTESTSTTSVIETTSPTSTTSQPTKSPTSEPATITTAKPTTKSTSEPSDSTTLKPKTSSPSTSAPSPVSSTHSQDTPTTTVKPLTTETHSIELITSVVTVSGSVVTSISSSTAIVPISQPTADEPTSSPSANPSGISNKTRNTVIGVVVGIGGAALLASLSLVAWRIWGRRDADDHHGLMDFRTGSPGQEKTTGGGNIRPANPFQSTLENYHNPTRVNASSNF